MAASPMPTRYQRQPTKKTAMKTATTRIAPRSSRRSDASSVGIIRSLRGHGRLAGDLFEVREPADHESTPRDLAMVFVLHLRGEHRAPGVRAIDRDLCRGGLGRSHRRERDLGGALDVASALPRERADGHPPVVLWIVWQHDDRGAD